MMMRTILFIILFGFTSFGFSEKIVEKKGRYLVESSWIFIDGFDMEYTENEVIARLAKHRNPENVTFIVIGYRMFDVVKNPITEKTLQYLSDHFPNVNELCLYGLKIKKESLEKTQLFFPNLEYLCLGIKGSAPGKEMGKIAEAMPSLKMLCITFGDFSDEAVDAFLLNCPSLHTYQYGLPPDVPFDPIYTVSDSNSGPD